MKRIAMAFAVLALAAGCGPVKAPEERALEGETIRRQDDDRRDHRRSRAGRRLCVEVEGLMGPGIDPHLYKASRATCAAWNGPT